jgi:hypothetical protein
MKGCAYYKGNVEEVMALGLRFWILCDEIVTVMDSTKTVPF